MQSKATELVGFR